MADTYARRPPRLELPDGRVAEWRLRELMAGKGLFSAVQLEQTLHEQGVKLGPSQAHELLTRAPRQPRMAVLFALCEVLDCTLADLWVVHHRATATPAEGKVAAGARQRLAGLKPVAARLEEGQRS
jgi:DNA-binding Xre family transcriptional regulator